MRGLVQLKEEAAATAATTATAAAAADARLDDAAAAHSAEVAELLEDFAFFQRDMKVNVVSCVSPDTWKSSLKGG